MKDINEKNLTFIIKTLIYKKMNHCMLNFCMGDIVSRRKRNIYHFIRHIEETRLRFKKYLDPETDQESFARSSARDHDRSNRWRFAQSVVRVCNENRRVITQA